MPDDTSMKAIPPLLSPSQVGKACDMSRRAAKNMLRAAGLLELVGSRWYVGEARLRERLPDVYDLVYEYFAQRTDTEVRDAV